MPSTFAALVDHYLGEWDSRGWAAAYHSLIGLGPAILPELDQRLGESGDGALRTALVELARALHSQDALPLFARALRDRSPDVWKAALDGLVELASPEAIRLLEEAARRTPPGRTRAEDWESWLQEAIGQARAGLAARADYPA
jgi:HEAT repeat protein